jgi:hypothetical protein
VELHTARDLTRDVDSQPQSPHFSLSSLGHCV